MVDAIVIGAAAGGLLIGFVSGRVMAPGRGEVRQLQKQLQEAQSEYRQLKGSVRQHFVDTADKLNRLTEQYRDVHQHMAAGAAALCGTEDTPAFAALRAPIEGELAADEGVAASTAAAGDAGEPDNAPRDFAPEDAPPRPGAETSASSSGTAVQPPRDYAPKTSPDDPGVLNERFGLDEGPAAAGAEASETAPAGTAKAITPA